MRQTAQGQDGRAYGLRLAVYPLMQEGGLNARHLALGAYAQRAHAVQQQGFKRRDIHIRQFGGAARMGMHAAHARKPPRAAAQADIAQGNAGGIADGDINDLAVAGDIERDFPVQSAGIPAHQASKLNGQVFIPFNGEII